jgi:tetratricopeptide (TPR) repeat protein
MAQSGGAAAEASDILAAALEHHQAGRRDLADELYRQALDADPVEPTALYLYGLLNFEAGRADRAADLFEQVVALRPDHAEAQVTLANLRHWRGEHQAAIAAYRRAAALDADRADAAIGLANALRESGDVSGAVEAGESAAARFPTQSAAQLALGAARFAARDIEAAVAAYRAAIDLDPRQMPAHAGLALALLEAGRAEAAVVAADAALALDPTLAEAWFARGAASLALRRVDEAIIALERAAILDPSRAATQLNLGAAYAEQDCADAAERCLEAALALDPSLAEAHASLGSVYLRADRKAAAERHSRRALALDPAMLAAHQNLASLLAEQGRTVEAKRHRDLAYVGRNLFPELAPGSRATVLMPTTAESGNVPLRHLLSRDRFSRLNWMIEYASEDQQRSLPPYDLVFNAIGDADLAGPTEAPMRRFLTDCPRPVLNRPDKVARTRRDRLPALLGDILGVVVPAVARLPAAALEQQSLVDATLQAGLAPPLLVRPAGSHGGQGLERADTPAALAALDPSGDVYVTQFCDYRSADGYYRKYRVIFVDRRPYPYHLAISRDWLLHYENAGMAEAAAGRAEEQRFLDDPEGALGALATQALGEIGRRLDLDYAGVDFSLLDDGRLLVFEANATMLVHPEAQGGVFAYKNRAVAMITDAFEAMVLAAARA